MGTQSQQMLHPWRQNCLPTGYKWGCPEPHLLLQLLRNHVHEAFVLRTSKAFISCGLTTCLWTSQEPVYRFSFNRWGGKKLTQDCQATWPEVIRMSGEGRNEPEPSLLRLELSPHPDSAWANVCKMLSKNTGNRTQRSQEIHSVWSKGRHRGAVGELSSSSQHLNS